VNWCKACAKKLPFSLIHRQTTRAKARSPPVIPRCRVPEHCLLTKAVKISKSQFMAEAMNRSLIFFYQIA
jgi:hypothetical protein